jgi:hypothetical protein
MLGCFEEYHTSEPPKIEIWNKIKLILEKDYLIHKDLIIYYQCIDEEDNNEILFPITLLMREIKIK